MASDMMIKSPRQNLGVGECPLLKMLAFAETGLLQRLGVATTASLPTTVSPTPRRTRHLPNRHACRIAEYEDACAVTDTDRWEEHIAGSSMPAGVCARRSARPRLTSSRSRSVR